MNNLAVIYKLICMAGMANILVMITIGFLAGLTGIGLMGAAAWIISYAALQPPLYALTIGITCVRFFGLSRAAARYLMRLFAHKIAFKAYEQLQLVIYDTVCKKLPLSTGITRQSLYLQQLSQDAVTLRDMYIRCLLPVVGTALLTLCLTLWLQSVSPMAACLLWFLLGIHLLIPALMTRDANEFAAEADYRDKLLDLAQGHEELAASGSMQNFLTSLDQAAAAYGSSYRRLQLRQDQIDTLLALVRHLAFILYIGLLINAVELHLIVPRWLAVWSLVALGLFSEFRELTQAAALLPKGREAAQRVFIAEVAAPKEDPPMPYMAKPEEQPTPYIAKPEEQPAVQPLLQGEAITFTYSESGPIQKSSGPPLSLAHSPSMSIFTPLSFSLPSQGMLAIRGDSGSGKTTLAQLLLKFWPVTTGKLQLMGIDYQKWPATELRKYFSAALQPCHIFAESIKDNFTRLHPHITEEKIWSALEIAQLGDTVRRFPRQLEEPLGENGQRLSGGQRNRLLTALAVASEAPCLILDEPTDGLDKQTAAMLLDSLISHTSQAHKALLIITHDEEVASRLPQAICLTPPPMA